MIKKQVKIFNSATISLFKDILERVKRNLKTGKTKSGIKVHNVVNDHKISSNSVWLSEAKHIIIFF